MDFLDELKRHGVTDSLLTAAEKKALDDDGYVVFPKILDDKTIARWMKHYDTPEKQAVQGGTRFVSEMLNFGGDSEQIVTHPKLLAAAWHVLGRAFVVGVKGRDPMPGYGQQALHADWHGREPNEPFIVAQGIVMLDPYTSTNGATRIVPGSHKLRAPKRNEDPTAKHPREIVVVAPAGSALFFNGHVLHSGTKNQSDHRRRTLQTSYIIRNARDAALHEVAAPQLSEFGKMLVGAAPRAARE